MLRTHLKKKKLQKTKSDLLPDKCTIQVVLKLRHALYKALQTKS